MQRYRYMDAVSRMRAACAASLCATASQTEFKDWDQSILISYRSKRLRDI